MGHFFVTGGIAPKQVSRPMLQNARLFLRARLAPSESSNLEFSVLAILGPDYPETRASTLLAIFGAACV